MGREGIEAFVYLKASCVLAALLHDVGKASKAFQDKLRKHQRLGDPVRHEFLSVHAVVAAVEAALPDLRGRPDQDRAVAEVFGDARFVKCLEDVLAGNAVEGRVKSLEPSGRLGLPSAKTHGRFLLDVCHLVLTHHRLAAGLVDCDDGIALRAWPYLLGRENRDARTVLAGCAFKAGTKAFGGKADVEAWKAALAKASKAALAAMPNGAPRLRAGIVQHHGRLALMLGDHHASAVKAGEPRASDPGTLVYANTTTDAEGNPRMAQTLARHLVSVANATAVAACGLNRLAGKLPALVGDEIPDAIAGPSPAAGRFAWQAEAFSVVSAGRRDARRGFVGFLMASTGSGKTRAVPSVLLAARPGEGLRYSVGLGLRSLTLQTAHEYTSRLGFHRDGVSVALGSSLARRLDALKRRLDGAEDASDIEPASSDADVPVLGPGTDAEEEDVGAVVGIEGDAPVLDLPPVLLRMNGGRGRNHASEMSFLAAPILVSTLDQLMPVATSTRGGHLTAALRTATADLVVDEIDDFQPEDVSAICRLVEHAAAHGRNVVVSTATLPPAVASAVHAAYCAGRERHAALTGADPATDVAWLSDVPGACRFEAALAPDRFAAAHAGLAGTVAAHAAGQPWKRRVAYLDVGAGAEGFERGVEAGIARLHAAHHVTDPATGTRVSAGVVRMANVWPAMRMARRLVENGLPDGPDILVVPYVGTLLPGVRFHVEGVLDRLLSRAGEADPIVGPRSVLRPHLDAAAGRDLCVVVVTTSLEETGRDHDFDWAIAEPGSARGVVQLAGRVRRHRPPPPQDAPANVLVTSECLKALEDPGKERPFSMPGIETQWKNAHKREPGWAGLASHRARDIYAGEGWEESLTAAALVRPDAPRNAIAACERERWEAILVAKGGDGLGPVMEGAEAFLGDAHQRWRRFRRQGGPQTDFALIDGDWHILPGKGGSPFGIRGRVEAIGLKGKHRLLVPVDVEAMTSDLVERLGGDPDGRLRRDLLTLTLPSGSLDEGRNWSLSWESSLGAAVRRR